MTIFVVVWRRKRIEVEDSEMRSVSVRRQDGRKKDRGGFETLRCSLCGRTVRSGAGSLGSVVRRCTAAAAVLVWSVYQVRLVLARARLEPNTADVQYRIGILC